MRNLLLFPVVLCLFACSGSKETTSSPAKAAPGPTVDDRGLHIQTFTVNLDGTAKLEVVIDGGVYKPVTTFVRYPKGIETWSDYGSLVDDAGKPMRRTFTAYFPDITKAGLAGPFPVFEREGEGFTVRFGNLREATPIEIDDAEAQERLEKARKAHLARKEVMIKRTEVNDMAMPSWTVAGYGLGFDVMKEVDLQAKIVEDEAFALKLIHAGEIPREGQLTETFFMEELYGTTDRPVLSSTGGREPFFDYAAEVKAAATQTVSDDLKGLGFPEK